MERLDEGSIERLGIEARRDLDANEFWFLRTRDRLKERIARIFEGVGVDASHNPDEEARRIGSMLAVLHETHQELLRTISEAEMHERINDEN